jgi:hypothetical protein
VLAAVPPSVESSFRVEVDDRKRRSKKTKKEEEEAS